MGERGQHFSQKVVIFKTKFQCPVRDTVGQGAHRALQTVQAVAVALGCQAKVNTNGKCTLFSGYRSQRH